MIDEVLNLAADQAGISPEIRPELLKGITDHQNDPRKAAKAVELGLSKLTNFEWKDGERFLQECQSQKATPKNLVALFANWVMGWVNVKAQYQRAQRAKVTHPYLLLERGPVICECPIHGDDEGIILKIDDPYWQTHPLRETVFCRCLIRSVSKREYERLTKK